MPKSPQEMVQAIINNLPAKTGKTLPQWVKLVRAMDPADGKARVDWLKREHGLGTVTANLIVDEADGKSWTKPYDDPAALVDGLFAGRRSGLRPVYDALVKAVKKLGRDVTVSPRMTYVALIRRRQFGVIRPTTQTRVDLGLALPGTKATGRLVPAKNLGGGNRISHRVGLSAAAEVDAEVRGWLQKAYEEDGDA
jgi:predicted transport protein